VIRVEVLQMVAIAQFQSRVSPRFDHAAEFVLAAERPDGSVDSRVVAADGLSPRDRVHLLVSNRVGALICGGIDAIAVQQLSACGIEVYSGVTGETSDALQCFLRGELEPRMMMGVGGRCRGRWRSHAGRQCRQRGRGSGPGSRRRSMEDDSRERHRRRRRSPGR
jgi:predicted Fe-Mo cluster-binding NifX family protein